MAKNPGNPLHTVKSKEPESVFAWLFEWVNLRELLPYSNRWRGVKLPAVEDAMRQRVLFVLFPLHLVVRLWVMFLSKMRWFVTPYRYENTEIVSRIREAYRKGYDKGYSDGEEYTKDAYHRILNIKELH